MVSFWWVLWWFMGGVLIGVAAALDRLWALIRLTQERAQLSEEAYKTQEETVRLQAETVEISKKTLKQQKENYALAERIIEKQEKVVEGLQARLVEQRAYLEYVRRYLGERSRKDEWDALTEADREHYRGLVRPLLFPDSKEVGV